VLRQYHYILATFAQGGYLQEDYRQAVIEVRAEAPLRDVHTQIHRGGGDELDVQLATLHSTQAAYTPLLNGVEEFALERERQRVDLVQKQRALRCALHETQLGAFGVGKGAGLEAEQLHFQERLRDGGTVDVDKRTVSAWAAVMDDARHQPLARTRFPLEQQGRDKRTPYGVKGGEVADLGAQGLDSGSMPHNTVRGMGVRDRV
jgi:hypothetical protein